MYHYRWIDTEQCRKTKLKLHKKIEMVLQPFLRIQLQKKNQFLVDCYFFGKKISLVGIHVLIALRLIRRERLDRCQLRHRQRWRGIALWPPFRSGEEYLRGDKGLRCFPGIRLPKVPSSYKDLANFSTILNVIVSIIAETFWSVWIFLGFLLESSISFHHHIPF